MQKGELNRNKSAFVDIFERTMKLIYSFPGYSCLKRQMVYKAETTDTAIICILNADSLSQYDTCLRICGVWALMIKKFSSTPTSKTYSCAK